MDEHQNHTSVRFNTIKPDQINAGLAPITSSQASDIHDLICKVVFILVLLLTLFSVTACTSQTVKYTPPPAELVAKIQATNWLENMDNGGNTCSYGGMSLQERRDCAWVEGSLLPPLDSTKRQHFGQLYDPKKYAQCRIDDPTIGDCNIYKLRRIEQDPVWPYPDVPAIKWPQAPEKETYKRGMSSKEYFDALCEAEAGQFIYRTVENVEGIYQVRPRVVQQGAQLKDRYVMEDPAFQQATEDENGHIGSDYVLIGLTGRGKYYFWETSLYEREWHSWNTKRHHPSVLDKPSTEAKFIHYAPAIGEDYDPNRPENITKQYTATLKSRYGYVWRGIQRPHDREKSIAGGEIAIIDLHTNELLALWRSFARTGKTNLWWLSPETCHKKTGTHKEIYQFISKVLKPTQNANIIQGVN